jgi:hypothetical protein
LRGSSRDSRGAATRSRQAKASTCKRIRASVDAAALKKEITQFRERRDPSRSRSTSLSRSQPRS